MKITFILALLLTIFACADKDLEKDKTIIEQLNTNYQLLPEAQISQSLDKSVYACYTNPTDRYGHGILGDKIEGGQMVVVIDSLFYGVDLAIENVFEDIRPRLYDVDNDGKLEIITIRSNVSLGAGIVIYKLVGDQLIEYAQLTEIGSANRWLNIVTIEDLDNDGVIEIAWIETPHIGGILKVAKILAGTLEVLDENSLYSNHAIGERNLCLSVLTEQDNQKRLYVPNQSRDKIVGFSFTNNKLELIEEIDQAVDFSKTLRSQYDFSNIVSGENNCIVDE